MLTTRSDQDVLGPQASGVLKPVLVALTLAFGLALPRPAAAQYKNPADVWVDIHIKRMIFKQVVDRAHGQAAAGRAPMAKDKHQPISRSDFKPSGKRPTIAAYLATMNGTDAQRAQLSQIVDLTVSTFEKEARKNNVAYAFALMIGMSLRLARDGEFDEATSEELALGINDLLVAAPAWRKLDAKDRQAMYESCLLTSALLLMYQAAGEADPDLRAQGAELARSVLAQWGAGAP